MPDEALGLPTTLLAYDSTLPYAEGMPLLADELESAGVEVIRWEEPVEPGPIWSGPTGVKARIDEAGFFLGEITRGNGNVLFELGYAIGSGKHAFGLFDLTNRNGQRLVILEDQAQIQYERRPEIHARLAGLQLAGPPLIEQLGAVGVREHPNGLFFLPSRSAGDLGSAVLTTARESMFRVATMDSDDSSFLKLSSVVESLAESRVFVGILMRDEVSGSEASNAHTMFIAGIAAGLGKRYVLVAEKNGKRFLDLGENLLWATGERSAVSQLSNWLQATAKTEWQKLARTSDIPFRERGENLLEGLSLGGPDARMDLTLPEYFVKTPEYRLARNGDRNFFVGAKGSGKSAAYEMLFDEFSGHSNDILVAINPSEFEFPHLARIFDDVPFAHANYVYSSFWRFILITEIVRSISDDFFDELLIDSGSTRPIPDRLRRSQSKGPSFGTVLVDWIDEYGDLLSLEFASRVTRVLDDLADVAGSDSQQRRAYEELLQTARLYDIEKQIAEFASSRHIRLLIDDLDRNWDPSFDSSIRLISSLLTAVQDLFTALRPSLTPTVFLRADVDEAVKPFDTERGRRGFEELTWTPALIEQLIGRRLAVKSGIQDPDDQLLWGMFFPQEVGGERTSEFVTARSLARPRHAITLCQEAINAAQRAGREDVTEDDLLTAESVASELLASEIEAENQFRYPRLGEILLRLFSGKSAELAWSALVSTFVDVSTEYSEEWIRECAEDPAKLIEILYQVQFVGVEARAGNRTFAADRAWADVRLMLNEDFVVVLHPAFRSYVQATG